MGTVLRAVSLGVLGLGVVFSAACSRPPRDPSTDAGGSEMGRRICTPGGPAQVCDGVFSVSCSSAGDENGRTNCLASGGSCVPGMGCRVCIPNRASCDGNNSRVCNADGSGYMNSTPCDTEAGLACSPTSGTCVSLCEEAALSDSYIGCEYWPMTTLNSELFAEFEAAVVVSNPQAVAATVNVTRGGTLVETATVAAGSLATIRLPWVNELKGNFRVGEFSSLVPDGAYRLVSSVPVTVYQFNPLEFSLPADCAGETGRDRGDNVCFSYSNDASLLLPTHVLTGTYVAFSRPPLVYRREVQGSGQAPSYLTHAGFVAITAAEEGSTSVQVRFSSHVAASQDGTTIGEYEPGDMATFTLEQGDVVQIVAQAPRACPPDPYTEMFNVPDGDGGVRTIVDSYCNWSDAYDLTGTVIVATHKVAVVSGHACAFIPFNRWACDHLEEAMFPVETWGRDYVVSASEPLRPGEPNLARIISGRDGNTLTFDPPSVHASVTLNLGEAIEFPFNGDFRVRGTDAISVGQFLVGQDYAGRGTAQAQANAMDAGIAVGDPSLSLAIPTEQFRTDYAFLAPETFQRNFVTIIGRDGQGIVLDGTLATLTWRAVGTSGMATARLEITGGAHTMNSTEPFGILVYGFGSYSSYMYPGGLNLEAINVPF